MYICFYLLLMHQVLSRWRVWHDRFVCYPEYTNVLLKLLYCKCPSSSFLPFVGNWNTKTAEYNVHYNWRTQYGVSVCNRPITVWPSLTATLRLRVCTLL